MYLYKKNVTNDYNKSGRWHNLPHRVHWRGIPGVHVWLYKGSNRARVWILSACARCVIEETLRLPSIQENRSERDLQQCAIVVWWHFCLVQPRDLTARLFAVHELIFETRMEGYQPSATLFVLHLPRSRPLSLICIPLMWLANSAFPSEVLDRAIRFDRKGSCGWH